MQGYYFIYSTMVLAVCFILVRYFVLRKKSSAMQLFMEATKAENQGNYQEAKTTDHSNKRFTNYKITI